MSIDIDELKKNAYKFVYEYRVGAFDIIIERLIIQGDDIINHTKEKFKIADEDFKKLLYNDKMYSYSRRDIKLYKKLLIKRRMKDVKSAKRRVKWVKSRKGTLRDCMGDKND